MSTSSDTTGLAVELDVDPDLGAMMSEVMSGFSGPDRTPDPAAVWETLGEVGLARLTAPESDGGSGAGWVEAVALLRAAASAGVPVPFAETDLLAGPVRRAAGLADPVGPTATVAVIGSGGTAHVVPWAGATDSIVCLRATGGDGFEIADVPTAEADVTVVEAISEIPTADVRAPGSASWAPVSADAVESFVRTGALVRAVQCEGAMSGMLASAIEHTTQRNQFGRALAKFQSVQNLVVDIAAESVLARAAVDTALADAVAEDLRGDFSEYRLGVARSVVARALAVAVRNAHQAHGAIGTTHEHTLHRLTLPALQWRTEFGSAAFWEAGITDAVVAGGIDTAWSAVVDGITVRGEARRWLDVVTGTEE